jgi:hypothetical protein
MIGMLLIPLEENGLISFSRRAKSVYLTDEGVATAKRLLGLILLVATE